MRITKLHNVLLLASFFVAIGVALASAVLLWSQAPAQAPALASDDRPQPVTRNAPPTLPARGSMLTSPFPEATRSRASSVSPSVGAVLASTTFIQNKGQWDESIRFLKRASSGTAFFQDQSFLLSYSRRTEDQVQGVKIRMSFESANSVVTPVGVNQSSAAFNFFLGSDRSNWVTDARGFDEICYADLYDGVSVCVRTVCNALAYDLMLDPWADLESVSILCDGIENLDIKDGQLQLRTALGTIVQSRSTS